MRFDAFVRVSGKGAYTDGCALNAHVTLVTPSYARDYERFALQRQSMDRCGIDLPHLAVVHTEDMELFRGVKHQRNLRILSTEQVLGKALDRRRRAWKVRRLNYLHWVVRNPIAGWMS